MPGLLHDDDSYLLEETVEAAHVADDPDSPWWRILADLHPAQRAVIEDPSNRKCLEKGRRAGGSYVVGAWLLEEYHRWPGATSLFVAQTKEHAKAILWPVLEEFDKKYELGGSFNALDLTYTLPNGYSILLRAAKDRAQVEKLRGIAGGLRRAAVDESGSFLGHDVQFRYLIGSVITPQFMDTFHLGGGQLILCGSPAMAPMGFFYEKCSGRDHKGRKVQQWNTHHWTALENPYLDAAGYFKEVFECEDFILDDTKPEAMVAELVALKGVPLSDGRWAPVLARLAAEFRREYLADWVNDTDANVYRCGERNMLAEGYELPPGPWRIVVAADVGWGDGNGFAVAAKSLRGREIILLRAYYLPEMNDAEIAAELKQLKSDWHTSEAYVDCGGEGDRLIANMEHHGVLVQPLGKGRKKPRIEYTRAVLHTGALKIRPEWCGELLAEWSALPWSEDKQTHREGYVDDVTDAAIGAISQLSQRFVPAKSPRPKPGDADYADYAEKLEKAAAVRAGRRIVRRKRTVRQELEPAALPLAA